MSGIPNDRARARAIGVSSEDYYEDDNSPCRWCFEDTCYGCELVPEPEDRPDYDENEEDEW